MVGWVHSGVKQTGDGGMFNMILRDGTRSDNAFTWKGTVRQRYDYFLPKNNRITKVTIHYYDHITGFRFHFSDGSEWGIGYVDDDEDDETVTVDIADNEVIVGFNSKSHPRGPAYYVEWQFITAK